MSADEAWRARVAARVGGAEFDAPGGGYAFSDVLAEERELAQDNRPNEPGSALLTLSIADPTWKMHPKAMDVARAYYEESLDATRYTDNSGVRAGGSFRDTHECLAEHLTRRFPKSDTQFTPDWVQYSPGSIKRALSEYIPTLLLEAGTTLVFPAPGYPVIKSPLNRYDADTVDVPLVYDGARWTIPTDIDVAGRLVVYANIPHNPTGAGYTRDDWEALLAWARGRECVCMGAQWPGYL